MRRRKEDEFIQKGFSKFFIKSLICIFLVWFISIGSLIVLAAWAINHFIL